MSPFSAWTPGPGPLFTVLSETYRALHIPDLPIQYQTWISGESPLSTQKAVVAAIGTYLLVVFGGREIMRSQSPKKLTPFFQAHNLFLSVASAILLALMLEEVIPLYLKYGFYWSICNTTAFTPRLVTYYMINYYIKYLELLDTGFLVLKKKPLAFLHVFHHAATAVLCFTQLEGATSVQWVVIGLNLTVHVIMYYYYYATAGGAKIWWKKYLTTMQITQFVIDLFITYFASYQHFAYRYFDFMPIVGDCAGSEGAALFGCALLTSYLLLFIAFYRATYKRTGSAGKSAKTASEKIANGSAVSAIRNGNGTAKTK